MTPLAPQYVPSDIYPSFYKVIETVAETCKVRRKLALSDWAEQNIVLSPEYSNRTGPLHLFGWQREIFDSLTNPHIQEIVLMTGVQMVKTISLMCAIAYIIAEDPGPILLVEPKDDAARQFSKRRLMPMSRDCPVLRGRISDSNHDGKNTILGKEFPGGNLLIVSAITPTDLAQHTIRYVLCDEPDKYPESAGEEGDPMDLAWQRALTFGSRRKRIMACSPTTAGKSRIGKAYASSDQRKPWVPCPYCGTYQILTWKQVKGAHGESFVHDPLNARYECVNIDCRARWSEVERWAAVQQVQWRADRPGAGDGRIAGFWINHLYLPYTWKSVGDIASHWLKVQRNRQQLRVFVNTVLAEEWQEAGETPSHEILFGRREQYPHTDDAIVPTRGLFLTAAVDVQDSPPRLEVEVAAWGRGRERWSIGYWVLQAYYKDGEGNDTAQPLPVTDAALWERLDREILQRNWLHASGHTLPILAMAIDTGNRPKPVYEFATRHPQLAYGPAGIRLHASRTVVPIKGTDDDLRIISSVSKEDAARQRQGVRILGVGTHCAKQEIFDLLQHVRPDKDGDVAVPGCYHFPEYMLGYFEGLASERRVVHPHDDKKVTYEKIEGRRNEPLDLAVYNRGMASVVGIDRFTEKHWQAFERALTAPLITTTTLVNSTSTGSDSRLDSQNPNISGRLQEGPTAQALPSPSQTSVTPARPISRPIRGTFR
jgi:phage terminase large subunit GpA-like protein